MMAADSQEVAGKMEKRALERDEEAEQAGLTDRAKWQTTMGQCDSGTM